MQLERSGSHIQVVLLAYHIKSNVSNSITIGAIQDFLSGLESMICSGHLQYSDNGFPRSPCCLESLGARRDVCNVFSASQQRYIFAPWIRLGCLKRRCFLAL